MTVSTKQAQTLEILLAQYLKLSLKNRISQIDKAISDEKKLIKCKDDALLEENQYLLDVKTKLNSGKYLLQLSNLRCELSTAFDVAYRETIDAIRALDNKLDDANNSSPNVTYCAMVKTDEELLDGLPTMLKSAAQQGDCVNEINTVLSFLDLIKSIKAHTEKSEKYSESILKKIGKLSDKM